MSHLTVFLVRHGAHDLLGRTVAGRMDGVPLNAEGLDQARRAAARLRREPISTLYTSPLERARQTAEAIGKTLDLLPIVDPGINELDFGSWTGAALSDLASDARWGVWNRDRASSRIPDGETMAEVRARAKASIERWRVTHPGGVVVSISHGDTIKAAICGLIGLSFDNVHRFDVDPGSITALVVWDGGGKLLSLNEVPT